MSATERSSGDEMVDDGLVVPGKFRGLDAELCIAGDFLVLRCGNAELAGYRDDYRLESVGSSPTGRAKLLVFNNGHDEQLTYEASDAHGVAVLMDVFPPELIIEPEPEVETTPPPELSPAAPAKAETEADPTMVTAKVAGLDSLEEFRAAAQADVNSMLTGDVDGEPSRAATALDVLSMFVAAIAIWNFGRTAWDFTTGDRKIYTLSGGFRWFVICGLVIGCVEMVRRLIESEGGKVGLLGYRPWFGEPTNPGPIGVGVQALSLAGLFIVFLDFVDRLFQFDSWQRAGEYWYEPFSAAELTSHTFPVLGLSVLGLLLGWFVLERNINAATGESIGTDVGVVEKVGR